MNRRTYHFGGRVQGVGFRYTTEAIARRHPAVHGYVRNLPDGRVQLVIEGPDEQMDRLVEALQAEMERHIRQTNVESTPGTGEFSEFEVRH